MLKKRDRLTARDIETLDQGKSVFGTLVSLRIGPSPAKKVSVSVSKKAAARAVDRSRIRRRVYSAVEKVLARVNAPVFVLVMPKKECLSVPFSALSLDVEKTFIKAKILS